MLTAHTLHLVLLNKVSLVNLPGKPFRVLITSGVLLGVLSIVNSIFFPMKMQESINGFTGCAWVIKI